MDENVRGDDYSDFFIFLQNFFFSDINFFGHGFIHLF